MHCVTRLSAGCITDYTDSTLLFFSKNLVFALKYRSLSIVQRFFWFVITCCICQGRLLVGVGRLLRIYDLGKKKMLRKCENKVVYSSGNWLFRLFGLPVLSLNREELHPLYQATLLAFSKWESLRSTQLM